MSVFSINTQPKNAFNLEAAAKHGDLRSTKRIKNIVLNKNKACYWNAKCKFRCLINLFDHRGTCRQPAATLGYGAFGGKIVYNLRWAGRGNYPTNLSRKSNQFELWMRGTLKLLEIIIHNIYLTVDTIMSRFNSIFGLNVIFLCFQTH